jgi:hypothetical protein
VRVLRADNSNGGSDRGEVEEQALRGSEGRESESESGVRDKRANRSAQPKSSTRRLGGGYIYIMCALCVYIHETVAMNREKC